MDPVPKAAPTPDTPPPMNPAPSQSTAPPVIQEAADEDETVLEDGAIPPINTRLIAAVIDLLVMIGLQFAASILLPDAIDSISWLVGAAYLVTRDSLPFLKQGSIGKMAMKLRVEKVSGGSMESDWTTAAIRNAPLLIPLFGLVEAIVLFNRENDARQKGLRLGDEWAKTRVVVSAPPATPEV